MFTCCIRKHRSKLYYYSLSLNTFTLRGSVRRVSARRLCIQHFIECSTSPPGPLLVRQHSTFLPLLFVLLHFLKNCYTRVFFSPDLRATLKHSRSCSFSDDDPACGSASELSAFVDADDYLTCPSLVTLSFLLRSSVPRSFPYSKRAFSFFSSACTVLSTFSTYLSLSALKSRDDHDVPLHFVAEGYTYCPAFVYLSLTLLWLRMNTSAPLTTGSILFQTPHSTLLQDRTAVDSPVVVCGLACFSLISTPVRQQLRLKLLQKTHVPDVLLVHAVLSLLLCSPGVPKLITPFPLFLHATGIQPPTRLCT